MHFTIHLSLYSTLDMDPWAVIKDLRDVKKIRTEIHLICHSFAISLQAIDQIITSKASPTAEQSSDLDKAEDAVFRYWMFMRHQLRSRDHVMPSPVKTQMLLSNTLLPWFLMSKLHLYRVMFEYGVEDYLASEQAAFSVWFLKPFAKEVLSNCEGLVVCKKPPCQMKLAHIKSVFYVLTSKWREFHYVHHQRIYEYIQLVMKRMFIMTAISPGATASSQFTITEEISDAFIYEFELHGHTLMYNFFITKLFEAKPFSQRPDFDEEQYVLTKARLERWLRVRLENGKFDRLRAIFSSEMTNMCPRPTQRERLARIIGRKTSLISSRHVLQNEEAQQNKLDAYLSQQNVVHRTLAGEIGNTFSRQFLFMMIFDMFLSNNFNWSFKTENVYFETGLSDSNRLVELSRAKQLPFLLCACNTHMLVLDGEIYPVTHFLDAMTQFILVTRYGDMAMQYPGFYSYFLDIHGYQPPQEELETISIDYGVYDISFKPIVQGFVTDSDSDQEEEISHTTSEI